MADSRPPPFDVIILAGGRGARLGGADKPGLVVGSSTMAATAARAAVNAGARRIILVGPDRPDVAAVTAPAAGPGLLAAAAAAAADLSDAAGGAGCADAAGAAAAADPSDAAGGPGCADAAAAAGRAGAAGAERVAGLVVTREDPPGAGPVPALRAGLAEVRAPWVAVLAADLPFLRGDQLRRLLAAASGGSSAGAVIADESGAAQWLAGCWRTEQLGAALAAYQGSSLGGLLGPLRPALVRDAGPEDGPSSWLDCDTPDELAAARAWLAARATKPRAAGPGAQRPARTGQTEADPAV